MKKTAFAAGTLACLLLGSPLFADSLTFTPSDPDLGDLAHDYYYTWGMEIQLNGPITVTAAQLSFDDIRDWTWESNRLYVNLLDSAQPGVTRNYDNEHGGNNFDGEGLLLHTYENLPAYPQDLVYHFDQAELAALTGAINNDGNFGIGIDPDCHFYNNGVRLQLSYGQPVPEPATLGLLILGGIPVILNLRRRSRARR
jgi:hypothetical protein